MPLSCRPDKYGLAEGDTEALFRACLHKLLTSEAALTRFSQGASSPRALRALSVLTRRRSLRAEVTFAVIVEMRDDAPPPESKAARAGVRPLLSLPLVAPYSS